ncbi:MAG: Spx/MgsR family RNA polymerase-binding regulatory protein [Cyanobacteria bacterium J06623_7]
MSLQVYGIPNCGTCKKAIAWLRGNDIEHEFINTKDNPPEREAIASWVDTLGSKGMRNTSGKSYRALGEARNSFSDEQWIDAFAADAMLLKRPLFVRDSQAILVGFRASEAELKEKLIVSIPS